MNNSAQLSYFGLPAGQLDYYSHLTPQSSEKTPQSIVDSGQSLEAQVSGYNSVETLQQASLVNGDNDVDVTDMVLHDRVRILGSAVRLLHQQLENRAKIHENSFASIDYKIVQCDTYIIQLEHWHPFVNPLVDAKRGNLYHEISNLETRHEGVPTNPCRVFRV